jgi:hypothetical protein
MSLGTENAISALRPLIPQSRTLPCGAADDAVGQKLPLGYGRNGSKSFKLEMRTIEPSL